MHRAAFGERDARRGFDAEQAEESRFLRVIGAGGIAGRGPDAAVFFADEFFVRKRLELAVAAGLARALVEHLGHGFGQAVAEGLRHDRVVVVVLRAEGGGKIFDAVAGGDGETAAVIEAAALARGDVIGEAVVKLVGGFFHLLAQLVEARDDGAALLVGVDLDVVTDGVARPEADDGFGGEAFFGDDAGE